MTEETKPKRKRRTTKLSEEQKRQMLWGTLTGMRIALAETDGFAKTLAIIDDVLERTK